MPDPSIALMLTFVGEIPKNCSSKKIEYNAIDLSQPCDAVLVHNDKDALGNCDASGVEITYGYKADSTLDGPFGY